MATDVIISVAPSGGDYTSIRAAEAGQRAIRSDLVSRDERLIFEISAGLAADTERTDFDDTQWVCDATRNIIIRAAAGDEVNGRESGGAAIVVNRNFRTVMDLDVPFMQVLDIRIENLSTINGAGVLSRISCNPIIFERCVFKVADNDQELLEVTSNSVSGITVRNCVLINGSVGIKIVQFGSDADSIVLQSNTLFGQTIGIGLGASGIETSSSVVVENNAVFDTTTAYDGLGSVAASHNASDDATAPGTSAVTNITSAAFEDYAGGDYAPASGGVLAGAGTDLSADFTDDITGATRTQWDIGAFGIVGGGSTTVEASASQQSQGSDGVSVTQGFVTAPASSIQGQSSEVAAALQYFGADPVQSLQAQVSGAVTAFQSFDGAPATSTQAQSSQEAGVGQGFAAAPGVSTQQQASSIVAAVQAFAAIPADSSQVQASDAVMAQAGYVAIPIDSVQGQESEQGGATIGFIVTAAGSSQVQLSDAVSVAISGSTTPSTSTQAQDSESVSTVVSAVTSPDGSVQVQSSSAASAIQSFAAAVELSLQSQLSEAVSVTSELVALPDGSFQLQRSEQGSMVTPLVIEVIDSRQVQLSDVVGQGVIALGEIAGSPMLYVEIQGEPRLYVEIEGAPNFYH